MTDRAALEAALIDELARFIDDGNPHEAWTWLDLAGALLAPECNGPLADQAFLRRLVELHGLRARDG